MVELSIGCKVCSMTGWKHLFGGQASPRAWEAKELYAKRLYSCVIPNVVSVIQSSKSLIPNTSLPLP